MNSSNHQSENTPGFAVLLAFPFRIFFLLTAIYALLLLLLWMTFLFGGLTLPVGNTPIQWHSHEMLYGMVTAAAAGFLLTAITNWTGAKPLQGRALLALVLLWAAGRLVMLIAFWLPGWLVALTDLLFLAVLAIYVAQILIRSRNYRNLILVLVLALLALGNLLMQIGFIQQNPQLLRLGELQGFNVIALMMVVIAGRITPAFSANWLRQQGASAEGITVSAWSDRLAIGSMLLIVILQWLPLQPAIMGTVILFAAFINGFRLWQWAGWRVAKEPLLWILHLAYGWIVFALLLRAVSCFYQSLPLSVWQHAMGVGAIAMLILGVMTRVAMGHTGRPIKLPAYGILIYIAIIVAALARLLAAATWIDFRFGIYLAAGGWIVAFGLFLVLYTPILCQPRADGRPG